MGHKRRVESRTRRVAVRSSMCETTMSRGLMARRWQAVVEQMISRWQSCGNQMATRGIYRAQRKKRTRAAFQLTASEKANMMSSVR